MTAPANRTRRTLILVAKLALAAAILAFLFVEGRAGFVRLLEQDKHWGLLAAALAATFAGVTLSFVRWHMLVAALGLDVRLVETLRLGALGFALNFVSLGSVGGDLFKAIFLAKDCPGRRTEAVATVIADRVMGLVVMLTMASIASLLVDWTAAPAAVRLLVRTIQFTTTAGLVGLALVLFVPAFSGQRVRSWIAKVPLVGSTAARLIGAVGAYRNEKRHLVAATGLCAVVDALFIVSFCLMARGLPVQAPSLAQHFVIIPVANLAGAVPLTPSGLGTMELAVNELYQAVPGPSQIPSGDGTLVALGQRAAMIIVAVICLAFYVLQRAGLREVIHDVEEAAEAAEAF